MKNSGGRMLFVLAVLLCLVSQGLGSKLSQEFRDDEADLTTIDQMLLNAGQSSQQSSDPFYFTQQTNLVRTELDLVYTIEEYMEMKHLSRQKRTAAIRPNSREKRWPDNVVNYELKGGSKIFDERDVFEITKAMKEISHYTCIEFNETSTAKDRVQIQQGFGGCYSHVGMLGGTQPLGLEKRCRRKQIVVHELLHAIGIQHEQTRPDRDDYIYIHFEHIHDHLEYNFEKYGWAYIDTFGLPYDYSSVMHYGQDAFSANGQKTIVTRDSRYQNHIGKNPGLSLGDIKTLNNMYSCVPDSCNITASDCGDKGFVGKDCKCWCPGPTKSHPVEYCFDEDKEEKGSLDFVLECRDYDSECAYYAGIGYCQQHMYSMLFWCERSCRWC